MQEVPLKWTSAVLVLIFASLMLYLFVVVAERSESIPGHREEKPHPEAGKEPHTEAGEKPQTEMGERGETLFGIDLDSPFIVTAVITMWSLIALGLVWQARWALVGGIGWGALSVLGDAFELVSKAAEANWGLAVAALVVGVMHIGVVYMCFRAVRQAS